MKEIEIPTDLKKSEIVSEVEQKKELKTIASIRRIPGLFLWKLDLNSGIVSKVEIEKEMVSYSEAAKGIITTKQKVQFEQNTIYTQALNQKNAIKKFKKRVDNLRNNK
ncbi:MAG: hypothetical protein KA747_03775 [Ignavibacteriaceae bacterium]|nr:hypothetical protein [Ignavibacteriaceae bacterium]